MSPVIAAVKDVDGMKKCFESECQTVFVLYGTICNIGGIVREIKKHGKYAMVHADFTQGLGAKEIAVDFIRENTLADGVIISHAEGAARGIASAHADPTHLWRAFGLTMDGFRAAVAEAMAAKNTVEEDDDMIRYHSIGEMPSYYREEAAQLVDSGALQGDTSGDLNVSDDMIRGAIIGMRYAEARNPRYYSLDDVPAWAREETQRLIDRGALQGDGKHELSVTYDALQAMIVCQRMIDNAKEGKA